MQFTDVIGQDQLKEELPDLLRQNRLAHALLFLGKEGFGGLPIALAFAQYLVCEKVNQSQSDAATASLFGDQPDEEKRFYKDSCGVCPSCVKAAAFSHPDIHFSFPVVTKKSGVPPVSSDYMTEWRTFLHTSPYGNVYDWLQTIHAENKQGNITADECNQIIKKLNLKSFESPVKVLIMWMPEFLGNEGNKLLKLIEEPPTNTVFLFVAEDESQILSTILSRCQLVKIPALTTRDVQNALIRKNGLDADSAYRIAALSNGNYREALHVADQGDQDWQLLLRDWLNAILKNGPIAQVKWVEEVSKLGREKQKQLLYYFNHLLEKALRIQIIPAIKEELEKTERDFAERLNKIITVEQQEAVVQELDKAAYFIERNANAKMLFMALTLKIKRIITNNIVFLNE